MALKIDGKSYQVVEDMGFQPSVGRYAKRVRTEMGDRVAVRDGHAWRFWGAEDRTQPLREAAARGWPKDKGRKG